MIQKITKSGLDRFLPNTGTIKNLLYLILGCLILTGLFMVEE
ncbi:LPXTG cell wall anchor domain-containing protein [Enterococcus sp. DIV0724b]